MAWRERVRRALQVVREYSRLSSLHGVRHIVKEDASVKERLCWCLLVLVLFVAMCVLCYMQWVNNDSVPETVLMDGAASVEGEPFPCVSVCPSHQIDRVIGLRLLQAALEDTNKSYSWSADQNREDWRLFAQNESQAQRYSLERGALLDKTDALEQILVDLHRLAYPGISNTVSFFEETATLLTGLYRLNLVDFMKQAFPSCHTLFHSCLWRGIPFDCCKHFRARPTDLGYCYFFNVAEADRMVCAEAFPDSEHQRAKCEEIRRLAIYGPGSGLRMYFKTERDPLSLPGRAAIPTIGRASVEPSCTAVAVALETTIYAVPAGLYAMSLSVRRILVDPRLTGVPAAARECLMRHEWPGATPATRGNYPAEYSNLDCIVLCRRRYMQRVCGCLVYPFSLGDPISACDMSMVPKCIARVSEAIRFFRPPPLTTGFSAEEMSKGLECGDCLPNCERTSYSIDFRTPEMGDRGRPALLSSTSKLAKRTMLDVFFHGPNTAELYSLTPLYQGGQLLVAIGAMANLFLGISVLTMLEGFVVLVKCLWILCREPGGVNA